MVWIRRRPDHSFSKCFKRTLSAQLHFAAALLSVPAGWLLIVEVAPHGMSQALLVTLYAAASTFLFMASAMYHFVADGFECHELLETWLQRMDHFAILLMISACYTVFVPRVLDSSMAGYLLAVVWLVAIAAGTYVVFRKRAKGIWGSRFFSTLIYVLFGSLIATCLPAIWARLDAWQLGLLIAGGAMYVAGAVVYYAEGFRSRLRAFDLHEVWHLAVIGAYALHYLLMRSIYVSDALG